MGSDLNGKLFVIDGAHRLSALIAWANDDYGAGSISRKFFGEDGISEAQKKFAKQTEELIAKIGKYADLKNYAQRPEHAPNDQLVVRARKVFASTLDLQWTGGDATTAERSFFKINVSATMIDDTEMAILKARKLPNAIATRALIHAGRGHKFWLDFGQEEQKQTESLASKVHEVLFKPILENPITTTELPVAGGSYSSQAFRMLIDLVNMINGVTSRMWMESKKDQGKANPERLPEDANGHSTIRYLKEVNKAASLISGNDSGSLGLHPVVYFYGDNGIFQPAALLSAIKFFTKLKGEKRLIEFTKYRRDFEEFLVHHRHYINQIAKAKGSRTRPVESLIALYEIVLSEVERNSSTSQIVAALQADERLRDLEDIADDERPRKRFTKDVRSASYLKVAVESPIRCGVCGARMRSRSITADHIKRVEDGGMGTEDNLQFTHPFCNTGYNESLHARQTSQTEGDTSGIDRLEVL